MKRYIAKMTQKLAVLIFTVLLPHTLFAHGVHTNELAKSSEIIHFLLHFGPVILVFALIIAMLCTKLGRSRNK
ncbi:MAG: hypothetical protein AAGB35_00850 [Pseudomonadota bacterium]